MKKANRSNGQISLKSRLQAQGPRQRDRIIPGSPDCRFQQSLRQHSDQFPPVCRRAPQQTIPGDCFLGSQTRGLFQKARIIPTRFLEDRLRLLGPEGKAPLRGDSEQTLRS
jgi:hypothetical protein